MAGKDSRMKYFGGCDAGSTYTKCVIIDENGKIAAAVDTALLALEMAKENQQFRGGEGIVKKGIEKTISNVGKLGKDGMAETDKEILRLMIKK